MGQMLMGQNGVGTAKKQGQMQSEEGDGVGGAVAGDEVGQVMDLSSEGTLTADTSCGTLQMKAYTLYGKSLGSLERGMPSDQDRYGCLVWAGGMK